MGKYDDAMFRCLSDNNRFADLFNAVVFAGKDMMQNGRLEYEEQVCGFAVISGRRLLKTD